MKKLFLTGIILFSNSLIISAQEQKNEANPELKIIKAEYGAGEKWKNITRQLNKRIINNRVLSIKVSNQIAGDPYPRTRKFLKMEYMLGDKSKKIQVKEGEWLQIPPDVNLNFEVKELKNKDELIKLVKSLPAEAGFYAKNLRTGETLEYRPDQPACLASIVKIFVLLEVMRQNEQDTLDLNEPIRIVKKGKEEVCTISQALDKMTGISDNQATAALAKRVGYDRVNALPTELGIAGLSKKILPEAGVLEEVLNKRLDEQPLATELLPQHGTARAVSRYFEMLIQKKLINETISTKILDVFERNEQKWAPNATPGDFKSGGKGGRIGWALKTRPYNMIGWGAYVRNENTAVVFCLWFEWFPENIKGDVKQKWGYPLADSLVGILLNEN